METEKPNRDDSRIRSLYLQPDLYEDLRKLAKNQRRTIPQMAVWLLEDAIRRTVTRVGREYVDMLNPGPGL